MQLHTNDWLFTQYIVEALLATKYCLWFSWEWLNEPCRPAFDDCLPFLSADPLELFQVADHWWTAIFRDVQLSWSHDALWWLWGYLLSCWKVWGPKHIESHSLRIFLYFAPFSVEPWQSPTPYYWKTQQMHDSAPQASQLGWCWTGDTQYLVNPRHDA